MGTGLTDCLSPAVRQQFFKPFDGMVGDAAENVAKTSIRNARRERFDFLGYTFGPHLSRRTGREYIGCSPSNKSVNRIKEKVGEHLISAGQ